MITLLSPLFALALAPQGPGATAPAAFAVRAETLYTMAGPPISGGVVVIRGGKILSLIHI